MTRGAPGPTPVRSLVMRGIRDLAVESRPARSLDAGEVRVAVHAVGLCKSDVFGYLGANARRQQAIAAGGPLVMGHEAVGRVVEVTEGCGDLSVGTPVAIDPIITCGRCPACSSGATNVCANRAVLGCQSDHPGAYADSVIVPARNAVPFRTDGPLERGALVEPLAVGAHALGLTGDVAGRRVLVVGGGIIGTGAALQARRAGAVEVVVSEPSPDRRGRLEALGFATVTPDGLSGSFDVAVDCVVTGSTIGQCIATLPPRGVLVLAGIAGPLEEVPVTNVLETEKLIRGSYAFTHLEFVDVAQWVAEAGDHLDDIIEARIDFDSASGGFEAYAVDGPQPFRTTLYPGGIPLA